MGTVLGELCVILVLILANGFFAGAEIAIIAAGRGRLQQQAEAGSRGAKIALELASNPNRFLPTVQVGITLIGTLAAAFGGAHLGDFLTLQLEQVPIEFVHKHRHEIALGIVVLGMTYLSVVVGELTPKRLALHNANRLAAFVAQPMQWLAAVSRPAVWIMAKSTDCMLWFFGVHNAAGPKVSIEDIQHLIETGTEEGVLEPLEQRLALEALHLGERTVKQIMRPRMDIDAVDVNTPGPEVLGVLAMAGFSRLPVYEENLDQIIGYVHLKDVLRQQYLGWPIDLHKLLHPALFVPETLTIDRLLQRFQEQHNQLAIV
ncbi:MAG TPA: hemolysin family protein, partial [Planctomycetaceae bacterium]|nr:hemolysin family protein [Planctomycetaceae bacterium]